MIRNRGVRWDRRFRLSVRILLAPLLLLAACHPPQKQLIVIGVDGMDPSFVEHHWSALPNLAALKDRGAYARLATTMPPQSPVAWSTFATGLDPDQHGIYDFVRRDPQTFQPELSMSETLPARFSIPLGPYQLPLTAPHVISLRKGKTFWQTLSEHGVPVTILRIPANYPPQNSGHELAGMGTPDLRGSQGTFAFYTDAPAIADASVDGGIIHHADLNNGHAELRIEGASNSLRKDHALATATLNVDIDPDQPWARLSIGETQAIVRQGEWSSWIPADFPLIPHLASVHGMFRAYARRLHPQFELYISPINVDPLVPDLPISQPPSFSKEIARRIGRYSTLGIAEDTAALRQGVFDLPEFLSQTRLVFAEERRLFNDALAQFHDGLLLFYFSSVDQNSHILFGQHDDQLLQFYRGIDEAVGEAMRSHPSAELIVMSDHGFAPFNRAVNLNNWFQEQGWPRTMIRAMGLNAVYVAMPIGGRAEMLNQVKMKLLALRDPLNGAVVVERVDIMNGTGPDIIVGYARGYRASWKSGVGELGRDTFEDNRDSWIADHCINPADVPGVLFTSTNLRAASLKDLPTAILATFGIRECPLRERGGEN